MTVAPAGAAATKLVLLSTVVVPFASGGRVTNAAAAPSVSAKLMIAPPWPMSPRVQSSGRIIIRAARASSSTLMNSIPRSWANGSGFALMRSRSDMNPPAPRAEALAIDTAPAYHCGDGGATKGREDEEHVDHHDGRDGRPCVGAAARRTWVRRGRGAVRWGVERRGRLSGCRRREGLQLALFGPSHLGRADRPLSVADQLGDGELERTHPSGRPKR